MAVTVLRGQPKQQPQGNGRLEGLEGSGQLVPRSDLVSLAWGRVQCQTVTPSPVAVQGSGSAREVQGICTQSLREIGFDISHVLELATSLQPELGRWDPGLTSGQQQQFREGLQSPPALPVSSKLPVLLKGSSLPQQGQALLPPLPLGVQLHSS